MRFKISFVRDNASQNSLPLHHQKLIHDAISGMISAITSDRSLFNFSSLKGTSKIANGFMKFLSNKITLVLSGRNSEYTQQLVKSILEKRTLQVGRMKLIAKFYDVIPDPEFKTRMRYLCISPMVLVDPNKDAEKSLEILDPSSHDFNDLLYNAILDRMERAGYSESDLASYAEFELTPDQDYLSKLQENSKKYARVYKCTTGLQMTGYLLPFTLHAHPEVHKFIWQSGMGLLTEEGYGMVDVVAK